MKKKNTTILVNLAWSKGPYFYTTWDACNKGQFKGVSALSTT